MTLLKNVKKGIQYKSANRKMKEVLVTHRNLVSYL